MSRAINFGFSVAPVDAIGTPDEQLYQGVIHDCAFGKQLGYESAWFFEHHFTDYFPTPSPLLFMAHIAARVPHLGLGTCVLVSPWYHPIRFAEEISMLSLLADAPLHIGIGRGTAKLEYDAWGLDQEQARERWIEAIDVTRLAHSGEPFQYQGNFLSMQRKVKMRPDARRDRIHLHGAIGSPQSAGVIGEMGLSPLVVANFPLPIQQNVLDTWSQAARARGGNPDAMRRTIMIQAYVGDTDEDARQIVKTHVPQFFALQARHYEADRHFYKDIKGYEQFEKFFGNLKKMADPDQMDSWIDLQLCGTAENCAKQLQRYVDIGFDSFIVHVATYGVPRAVRHHLLARFAREVAPAFDAKFGRKTAAG